MNQQPQGQTWNLDSAEQFRSMDFDRPRPSSFVLVLDFARVVEDDDENEGAESIFSAESNLVNRLACTQFLKYQPHRNPGPATTGFPIMTEGFDCISVSDMAPVSVDVVGQ